MSMLQKLSRILGVREDQVDDALKSEQRAQRQLTRRGLLTAGAAIVAGQLLPAAGRVWSLPEAVAPVAIPLWSEIHLQLVSGVWLSSLTTLSWCFRDS